MSKRIYRPKSETFIPDDIIGRKYGLLMVIKYVGQEHKKGQGARLRNGLNHFYLCRCDCGAEKVVKRCYLFNGTVKSCGCLRRRSTNLDITLFNLQLCGYKQNALARGIEFNLTEQEFKSITQKDCFYCGKRPEEHARKRYPKPIIANGVDRLDSKQGYTADNCVPCCSRCNKMKIGVPFHEFRETVNTMFNRINYPLVYLGREL